MKKLVLGIAWQVLGFLGALVIVCTAAPHRWNYNGIEGLWAVSWALSCCCRWLYALDFLLPVL